MSSSGECRHRPGSRSRPASWAAILAPGLSGTAAAAAALGSTLAALQRRPWPSAFLPWPSAASWALVSGFCGGLGGLAAALAAGLAAAALAARLGAQPWPAWPRPSPWRAPSWQAPAWKRRPWRPASSSWALPAFLRGGFGHCLALPNFRSVRLGLDSDDASAIRPEAAFRFACSGHLAQIGGGAQKTGFGILWRRRCQRRAGRAKRASKFGHSLDARNGFEPQLFQGWSRRRRGLEVRAAACQAKGPDRSRSASDFAMP